jgi:hypothetical protein
MCATVCPSQALFFGTLEQIELLRPQSMPVNRFQFGRQTITTQVFVMMPREVAVRAPLVDVTAAMDEQPRSRSVSLRVVPAGTAAASRADACAPDPYDDTGAWP